MRIYIDTQGTLIGNIGGHSLQACLQAAQDLSTVAEVHFMSGDPVSASEQLGGAAVLNRLDVLSFLPLSGAIVVDDEPLTLCAAVRMGAAAVPASMLLELADAMVASRRERRGPSGCGLAIR
jgi:hypothetical protein